MKHKGPVTQPEVLLIRLVMRGAHMEAGALLREVQVRKGEAAKGEIEGAVHLCCVPGFHFVSVGLQVQLFMFVCADI